jgi:hypothetical protein
MPVNTTGNPLAPSIALPTVAGVSGSPLAVTDSGTATSNGYLTRTADGLGLVVSGYNADVGTPSVAGSNPATINRSIAVITPGGLNTNSGFSNGPSNNFRSVAAASPTGPIYATTAGSGSALGISLNPNDGTVATNTAIGNGNLRNVGIFANSLFVSSGSATPARGILLVGVSGSLPNLATSFSILPGTGVSGTGNVSPYGFVLFNNPLNPNNYDSTGLNTLYVADDRSVADGGGVQRWVFDGVTWNLTGTFTNAGTDVYRGLTASISGSTVTLFATTTAASANQLVTFQDALTATSGTFDASSVVLATAPANTVFRGVAFAPVPEPATVLGIAAGAFGVGGLVRRRLRRTPV